MPLYVTVDGSDVTAMGAHLDPYDIEFDANPPVNTDPTGWTVTGTVGDRVLRAPSEAVYAEEVDADPAPSGGASLPAGGSTGQVLTKASDNDGDADWEDASGGSDPSLLSREAFCTVLGEVAFGWADLTEGSEANQPWVCFDPSTWLPATSTIFDLTDPTAPLVQEDGLYAFSVNWQCQAADTEAGKALLCGLNLNEYVPPDYNQPAVWSFATLPLDSPSGSDPFQAAGALTQWLPAGAQCDYGLENHTGSTKHVRAFIFVQRIA